ncbi:hypothetical protein HanRHA438_Chr15g0714851 [Helianthus annuus]|nr:hypothetical protein HanRHA438_Chr15g0714851 [Helianthus annuus]
MLRWQIKFWRVQDCFGVFGSWSKLGRHKERDQSNTGQVSSVKAGRQGQIKGQVSYDGMSYVRVFISILDDIPKEDTIEYVFALIHEEDIYEPFSRFTFNFLFF